MSSNVKSNTPLSITPMSRLKQSNALMRSALASLGFKVQGLSKCDTKVTGFYDQVATRNAVMSEYVEVFTTVHPKNAKEGSNSVYHTMTFGVSYIYPTETNGVLNDSIVVSMYEKEKRTPMWSEIEYIERAGLHSKEMSVKEFRDFQKILLEKLTALKQVSAGVAATDLWKWFETEHNDVSFYTKTQKSGTVRKVYSK